MKAIFVIVMRPYGICSHCDKYKISQHEKVVEILEGDKNIKQLLLTASSTTEGRSFLESNYVHPQMLTTYWKWWPSFYLFTEESWNNPNKDLVGYMMGGTLISDNEGLKIVQEESTMKEYSNIASDIINWISKKLTTELFKPKERKTYKEHITDVRLELKKRGSF